MAKNTTHGAKPGQVTPDHDINELLHSLDAGCSRDDWVKIGMAYNDAGGQFAEFDGWSSTADNYEPIAARDVWRSFKPGKGVGIGTLIKLAKDNGWRNSDVLHRITPAPRKADPAPRKPNPGMGALEVWNRCEPATNQHGYIAAKRAQGVPTEGLRVVPANDVLRIMSENMAGALVLPCWGADGSLSTLQLIPPPEVSARLKAEGKPGKLNLANHSVQGWFTVGDIKTGEVVYVVEGVGQAWACWQATGNAAVVCFGAGNMGKVATALRERDSSARLVVVADRGKEEQAQAIAEEVQGSFVAMPEAEANNFDANDFLQREGSDALRELLESAKEPPKPAPRYKLLGAVELAALPPLKWRIRGVLPASGLAGLFGPSASGKSFLALDMAAAVAEGERWFDCRVEAAPVVYVALEGESGFKLRAQAWEANKGRSLPACLQLVMQPFKLTDARDVSDLAKVVPPGAVLFIDTLNRAAPTADENSSKDMGEILEGAKRLQSLIKGLVVVVHHTGKDTSKGLRGHSSLFAALDAAVEVSRDGDSRQWQVAKAKDGEDGNAHPFVLKVQTLGVDEYGDAVTSCTVQIDGRADEIKRVKLPQGGNQKLVYEGIRGLFRDGISGKPGAPPLRPCIELEAAVAAGASRLTCQNDRKATRTREAITGLVARGVLGLNEGWLWTV